MSMLRKDTVLFERDDKGDFIPQKIQLETKAKEEIVAKPMTRGEIRKLFAETSLGDTSQDQDKKIILNHCIDPKFTSEEVDNMKSYVSNAIVGSILKLSGVSEPDNVEGADELKKS